MPSLGESGFDVEDAVRALRVAAAHVLEPVLDQPHGHAEPAREITGEHRMLQAALHAVGAADIDVEMDAHRVARQPQRARKLVGIFRHLDRRPDVEQLVRVIPLRDDAESLDRHGRAAMPARAKGKALVGRGEILGDRSPSRIYGGYSTFEPCSGWTIGASGSDRPLRVDHRRQRLVIHLDELGRVLGKGAAVGDHRRNPLADIARHAMRQGIAAQLWRIEAAHHRVGRDGQIFAGHDGAHARQSKGGLGVDAAKARERIGTCHERDMQHARQRHIGDEAPGTGEEAAILLRTPLFRDIAEARLSHDAAPAG